MLSLHIKNYVSSLGDGKENVHVCVFLFFLKNGKIMCMWTHYIYIYGVDLAYAICRVILLKIKFKGGAV